MAAAINDKLCILNTPNQNAFAILETILMAGQISHEKDVSSPYYGTSIQNYKLFIDESDRDLVKAHLNFWATEIEATILTYPKRPVIIVNENSQQEPAGIT